MCCTKWANVSSFIISLLEQNFSYQEKTKRQIFVRGNYVIVYSCCQEGAAYHKQDMCTFTFKINQTFRIRPPCRSQTRRVCYSSSPETRVTSEKAVVTLPGVVAGVHRGEGPEGHVVRRLAVLRRAGQEEDGGKT